MIEAIYKNPFRFFGVYSNTSVKECIANENRVKRLCQVGKAVDFPMELNSILPKMERKVEDIDIARNQISLPEDKIQNALFWFINDSEIDGKSLEFLQQGDTEKALSLLYSERTYSSLVNRSVLTLLLGEWENSIANMTAMINDEEYRSLFIHSVCGPLYEISMEKLIQLYINELIKYKTLPDLFVLFKTHSKNRCGCDYIGEFISEQAEKAVDDILSQFHKQDKNIQSAKKLVEDSSPYLAALREIKDNEDVRYRHISTLVEETALNAIIADVNNTFEKLTESNKLSIFANIYSAWNVSLILEKLEVEPSAQQRFQEQSETLKGLLNRIGLHVQESVDFVLKTEWEIYYECKTIDDFKNYLSRFERGYYVQAAIEEIQKIETAIEQERNHLSGEIARITDINELLPLVSRCGERNLTGELDDKFFSLCIKKSDFKLYLNTFGDSSKHKNEAESHLRIDILIEKCKKIIVENKIWSIAILSVVGLFFVVGFIWGASGLSSLLTGMTWLFGLCAVACLNDDGDSKGCLYTVICAILAIACYYGSSKMDIIAKVNSEYSSLVENPTEEACKDFLHNHPNSSYRDDVLDIYYNLAEKAGLSSFHSFAVNNDSTEQGLKAKTKVKTICDSLYRIAEVESTIEGWNNYRERVPSPMFYEDSQEKIDSILNEGWNTESKAWKNATKENTISAYQKYLSMYPKGNHKKQADKKIIDLEVADIYAGDHGTLPSSERLSAGTGSTSRITIKNGTDRTLTILYSGPSSQRIVLSPNETKSVILSNGSYHVAASAYGVRSYAGTEVLRGGEYSSDYYIQTSYGSHSVFP